MPTSTLVVGSANMDLVFRSSRIPQVGETILGDGFATHPGGKGANQAVAIGRLGGSVAFAGCVGGDAFGEELRASLTGANVDARHLHRVEGPSGTAGILVDGEGRNLIVVAPGANGVVSPSMVEAALTDKPAVVLAQLEIPLEAVFAAAQAERFVLNPAPARPLSPELLSHCYVIIPNETEIALLTGIEPTDDAACSRAADALRDLGAANVVVTLGGRGCFLATSEGGRRIPAPSVRAIDTTAAGDAFCGSLAMFLAEGRDLANAVALANCVGALSTTRSGAQASMPSREELQALAGELY